MTMRWNAAGFLRGKLRYSTVATHQLSMPEAVIYQRNIASPTDLLRVEGIGLQASYHEPRPPTPARSYATLFSLEAMPRTG